eukprot:TRINITY_DN1108_c0_g1_i1.p1 TRINITY_DN1108_c0_g1~~TRINITY_DN1108_c0_g1_i1.p1  ORF type:complete len:667 (+),score=243.27 TRINITY_DN1108_c0_g1_i1:142-2142(+)
MIRRPPRSTQSRSSAASDVYKRQPNALPTRVADGRKAWENIVGEAKDPAVFTGHGNDVVEQLIVGLGWRLTAEYNGTSTRTVLCTSSDAIGVKIAVSCLSDGNHGSEMSSPSRGVHAVADTPEMYDHFKREHLDRFFAAHNGRQGIAVLGFEVAEGNIDKVLANYSAKHPNLLVDAQVHTYSDSRTIAQGQGNTTIDLGFAKTLEVYAYYKDPASQLADTGTVIRFVERTGHFGQTPGFSNPEGVLPGLISTPAIFDGTSIPAYSDHWVSNVVDRNAFLAVLKDTLGFTPKVDFNAGVVAAGEARIESTVTGNTSKVLSLNETDVLMNQTQVYLPINNPLSEVGHVHWFIEELGQGVQHVATRVANLTAFIERVNNYRAITGMGFAFLNIPRSYYGRLHPDDLVKIGLPRETAVQSIKRLEEAGIVSLLGIVELNLNDEMLDKALEGVELGKDRAEALGVIKRGRYSNMYSLLRDALSEDTYVKIVQNKILVDVQGGDILYQIFTENIMQREAGQEAPFIEFIQRVCSECREGDICKPIKPGCGGFGIRNFLTLFLSIEVSKAMREYDSALGKDDKAASLAQRKIDLFTGQLDQANPILTDISDAMTAEGDALTALLTCAPEERAALEAEAATQLAKKNDGSERLKVLSARCAADMARLREEAVAV